MLSNESRKSVSPKPSYNIVHLKLSYIFTLYFGKAPPGGGGTPIYGLYRYVPQSMCHRIP